MYTIGKLARRAQVNPDSIRFYERQRLVFPATKTDAGYRLYDDDAVRRIAFIKHAQRCGFSLAEIGGLLEMHGADAAARDDAYRLAVEKQTEIAKTIAALEAMSDALSQLVTACDEGTTHAPDGVSPLLSALETGISQQALRRPMAPVARRPEGRLDA
jgi:MerR family Zn(II)-responsive transcriptional regulator of zntA